jgi:hypothetical protein
MYVNGKQYLLKLFQKWDEEGMKDNSGGGAFKYNIFDML